MEYILDDIADNLCMLKAIYYCEETSQDSRSNQTFLFDFEFAYTKIPDPR